MGPFNPDSTLPTIGGKIWSGVKPSWCMSEGKGYLWPAYVLEKEEEALGSHLGVPNNKKTIINKEQCTVGTGEDLNISNFVNVALATIT